MITRRDDIQRLLQRGFHLPSVNAGLWLDKFIEDAGKPDSSSDGSPAKAKLVREIADDILESPIYATYYEQRSKRFENIAARRIAKVQTRIAIGLGSESVLETNISLHRVFGVPFIPGSSLKGLVAHFLHQYGGENWKRGKDNHTVVCGDGENAGFITFHDAFYKPGSGFNGRALHADVMTPHHSAYYGGKDSPPSDWDSPTPVSFLSATGEFLVALSGPPAWVDLVFKILEYALRFEGIGAKTSSGYGRMHFVGRRLMSDTERAEQKDQRFAELFVEMEKLLSSDKDTKKNAKRKLKDFTKKLRADSPTDLDLARRISDKAVELSLSDEIRTTDPDWFKPIKVILDSE